jgi:hypothetical protein
VVVDRRVAELPADACAFLGAGAMPVPGDLVAGRGKAPEALAVDLDQVTGTRPLKPPRLLARHAGQPREAAPAQAAMDGRVRNVDLGGDQPGPPTGAPPHPADPVVQLLLLFVGW